jgi:acyl-CoA synthetase (AMP-forming)/AMP-acid ligase II
MDFNLAEINEAVAAAVPERECLVWRKRRFTYAQLNERTRRLANSLAARGLGCRCERSELASWESGQDHVALYMYNCPEYLEGMIGAFKARLVPLNVNYRYVTEELIYLLEDSAARAIIYHSVFAPTLAQILPSVPRIETLIQVRDDSGNPLLPRAVDYEAALASASAQRPAARWSPDDLYILYTGGTTGRPKGVLWRQADIFVAAMGGRRRGGGEVSSLDEIVERARKGSARVMPTAPLMHAAHWAAFDALHDGQCVVLPDVTNHFDPDSVLSTAEREKVAAITIVGDAFARPLLDQLRKKRYDLSALKVVATGGAPLNAKLKEEILELLPDGVRLLDTVGSSETGAQASHVSSKQTGASTGTFKPNPGACVLSADLRRVLTAADDEAGWFAQAGRVPLGYLGDREKTERAFPIIDGVRYSVPGDRARLRPDESIEVLGRDSATINSGGEKIYAEEVEHALKRHPAVYDAVVCGRPSERWGSEVVAIVQLRPGAQAARADLLGECAKHLARYKLPKEIIFKDQILRSPSGKPDYRWAREVATSAA